MVFKAKMNFSELFGIILTTIGRGVVPTPPPYHTPLPYPPYHTPLPYPPTMMTATHIVDSQNYECEYPLVLVWS